MKDNMLHTDYMGYLNEVVNICVKCPKAKCWEDSTTSTNLCPRFKEERKKLIEKYKRKKA